MNNRTEAKLTDLSGMQKAINEMLQQAWERGRKYEQNKERPKGEWINVDAYSKWLKEQTIIGFDYEHCEVLIGRNGVWQSAIETYLKERSDEE